ncbi:MAG: MFS transporter [Thermoplasmata archaeon]|nr:MFS transporter [Thermoplasmata archaeon]
MFPIPRGIATPRRRSYRDLIGLVAIQSFGNQMAGSFWLVYLVSPPQSLRFDVAILLWVTAFFVAALTVLAMSRGRPIRAGASMALGGAAVAVGHLSFLFLPPLAAVFAAGIGFGVYLPLFWLPMNSLLVFETTHANRAGRLSGVTATLTGVAVIGPALGGFIATTLGYPVLFVLGGLVVLGNLVLVRRLIPPEESFSFSIDLRRTGRRTASAFLGQGGIDGLLSAATPLGSFLLTTNSLELGLLFALFSLAAGVAALVLGRFSDRVRVRTPFLLLGPILSVPACLLAFAVRDLGTFAFAVGWLSMTSAVAPSFIYTILVDRMEDSIPTATATRELLLNVSRTIALVAGLGVLALGADVYALYLLAGGVILLEALAK